MTRRLLACWLVAALPGLGRAAETATHGPEFDVSYDAKVDGGPLDGRLLLLISKDDSDEPRHQIQDQSLTSQLVFGLDVAGWIPGRPARFDAGVAGYPLDSLKDVPPGTYAVQALLHRYETFRRSDGHVVELPMDRGEGQQWSRAPGNLYSAPRKVTFGPGRSALERISLERVIPPIPPPADTRYVKHERILSERLTKFWGREMHLGAHVLLPWGYDEHPGARYPLVVFHGHFPADFGGFREQPPDPGLKCEYSRRFRWECYNRAVQEQAHQFFEDWSGPGYPRFVVIEIQHANPFYDDSYAVNSQNVGPYGDAITYELIPYLERKYRALGAGWARFMYGGSTGGWEAMAAQVFYPDDYNGAWIACPDPIDFHAYTTVDIYDDRNAYFFEGAWNRIPRPGHRDSLGHLQSTVADMNRLELVLGPNTRSGGQFDVWQAVYSPVGDDGYPKPIWDKRTGAIDPTVAAYWRENYDLVHILRRDWNKGLGRKLQGKLHLYVGDMDNFYLNNAVYLAEDFLKAARDPAFDGEVDYGDRAEHCWNGDHTRPNALSRLRYHQTFAPKIVERLLKSAPPGADLTSWRY